MNRLGCALIAILLAWSPSASAQATDSGRFHVAGFGRVAYQPDLFELSFAVVSDGADARAALQRHQLTVDAVKQVLQAHRQTLSEQSMDAPRLTARDTGNDDSKDDVAGNDGNDGREAVGYRYSTRWLLRVRGESALALLQQQLSQAGVSGFDNLRALSERLPEYGDQARRLALRDAHRKAGVIAAEMGWTLGAANAVKFEDERPWWTPQTPISRQYGARAYDYAAEAPAQTGEVTAQVDVEYRYTRAEPAAQR